MVGSKIRLWVAVVGCALGACAAAADLYPMPAGDLARLKARTYCSCLFVQRMTPAQCSDGTTAIWRYTSSLIDPPLLESPAQRMEVSITYDGGIVRLLDGDKALAKSRYVADGAGCITLNPDSADSLGAIRGAGTRPDPDTGRRRSAPLPRASLPANVDASAIQSALDEGFDIQGPMKGRTRVVVVATIDGVVADRYAPGFGTDNLYYIGSIAKTFNNFIAGLLVRDGKLEVTEKVRLPQWRGSADKRGLITYEHLLRMSSGLAWDEDFFKPGAPGYSIFFGGPAGLDIAAYMEAKPLEADPGTHVEYSTGASTLLTHALQAKLGGGGRQATLQYLERELFTPIGARQIVTEFDAAGTLLTGHAIFAGAEDLTRLGLLLLQDGVWDGRRILAEGWVDYSLQYASAKDTWYGAQLMTNMLELPGCHGHRGVGGQQLVFCPKRGVVIAWLSSAFDFAHGPAAALTGDPIRKILRAFPERMPAK